MSSCESQLELESHQHADYKAKFYKNINNSVGKSYAVGYKRNLVIQSTAKLKEAIENYLKFLKDRKECSPNATKMDKAAKALMELSEDELTTASYVAISYFFMSYLSGTTLQHASQKIGRDIMDELNYLDLAEACQEELTGINVRSRVKLKKGEQKKKRYLKYISWHNMFQNDHSEPPDNIELKYFWDFKLKVSIGMKFIELIEAKLGLIYFSRRTQYKKGKTNNQNSYKIILKPEILDLIADRDEQMSELGHTKVPMIYKPKEWTGLTDGGYYTLPHYFIRIKSDMDAKKVREFYQDKDLKPIMDAVNRVQETPWKINQKVLKVIEEIASWDNPPIEEIPASNFPEPPEMPSYDDKEAYKAWKLEIYKYHLKHRASIGKRIRVDNVIKFAKEYAQYDKFYFPCNVDFRGRIFPMPPYTYQGGDLERGLLCFADGVNVDNDYKAMDWMRINIANHWGEDKKTFRERLDWFQDNEKWIYDCVHNPLLNYKLWVKADNPIQFLAAIIDFVEMLQTGCSHIRISFDGSCSGIQHYSALFKDEIGGEAVNLIPSESVHDIYGIVAEKVEELCSQNALNGTQDTFKPDGNVDAGTKRMSSEWLRFGINRSLVKRPVMTFPYGSRTYGFENHIYEDTIRPLLTASNKEFRDIGFLRPRQSAIYLASKIMEAVKDVVVKAYEGMNWLQNVAKVFNDIESPIIWTSPSGFPCFMDYKKQEPIEIKRIFRESLTIKGKMQTTFSVPTNKRSVYRQRNGIAPNFIHSFDASHMHFTILEGDTQGITNWAMVHDDFGTDALNAEKLYHIVRFTFVNMYSTDWINKIASYWLNGLFPESLKLTFPVDGWFNRQPKNGNLDINGVLYSKYSFH